jgi:hypothetical protein
MPTATLHSYFWEDQGEVAQPGPKMGPMRVLGPPLIGLIMLFLQPGVLF